MTMDILIPLVVSQRCHVYINPTCRNHNTVISAFLTYHWVCSKNITTDATSGTETVYPSGAQTVHPPGTREELHQTHFFKWTK
jgi:hypothetical protein